jgi:hypothetical protein
MSLCAGLLGLALAWPAAGPEAPKAGPAVTVLLKDRLGRVVPARSGPTRSGGGAIDLAQPSPDVVVVTLTGVVVAQDHPFWESSASMTFELEQCFDVVFEGEKVKGARLTMEGRVIGLLRSGSKGGASEAGGSAAVLRGDAALLSVCVPDHSVAGGDNLSVNDRVGPRGVPVGPGEHVLRQSWQLTATHDKALIGKASSAEFAPDPALDPQWISVKESFHGFAKKDLGFQVILRVAEDAPPEAAAGK